MCEFNDYIKSMNPFEKDGFAPLFYGAKYMCFKGNDFIGIAEWVADENIGDSFHKIKESESVINVLIPDEWFLIPDKFQDKEYGK